MANNNKNSKAKFRNESRNRNGRGSKVATQVAKETDVRGTRNDITDNDLAWYNKNPKLLESVSNISFGQKCGAQLGYKEVPTIPGVFTLYWKPSFSNASVLQVAQDNLYSYVVHANSRNTSYEPADIMMYLLAADSLFSSIGSLIRVYGIMRKYDGMNLYTPKTLIEAMGLNYEDCLANYHKMWADLNYLIAQSHTIWIPNTYSFVARHFWLNSNVYKDGGSPKSQFYLFVQGDLFKYKPDMNEAGGGLTPIAWMRQGSNLKWGVLVETIKTLISALRDADIGTMSGDILKAYGKENLYMINELPIDYQVDAIENEEVLTQIHNSNNQPMWSGDIKQMNGYIQQDTLKSTVAEVAPRKFVVDNALLDFFKNDNPTPGEVMIATRLSLRGNLVSQVGDSVLYDIVAQGTEVVVSYAMYYLDSKGKMAVAKVDTSNAAAALDYKTLGILSMFDWAPIIYCTELTTDKLNVKVNNAIGDVENAVILDPGTLERIHNCAFLSEFDVPAM